MNNPAESGGRAWGLNDPAREDVQRTAFIHLIMQNTGMEYEEAEEYVRQKGIEALMAQFKGAKETDSLEQSLGEARTWQDTRKITQDPDLY